MSEASMEIKTIGDVFAGKGEKLGFKGAFDKHNESPMIEVPEPTKDPVIEKVKATSAEFDGRAGVDMGGVQVGFDPAAEGTERSVLCLTLPDKQASAQITYADEDALQLIVFKLCAHVNTIGVERPLPWKSKTELEDAIVNIAADNLLPPGALNVIMRSLGLDIRAARGRYVDRRIAEYNALPLGEQVKLEMGMVHETGMHYLEFLERCR